MTWRLRPATPADYPEMNALFATAFAKRPLAHDIWRFDENPFGPAVMYVAEDGGCLVGQYGVWPTPFRLGPEVYLGAQCIDAVTLPEYMGQGLFTKLAAACHDEAARRGIVAIYSVPNANSQFAFRHRLNMHTVLNFPRWTRLIDPAAHPRIPRVAAPVASLVSRVLPMPRDRSVRLSYERPPADVVEPLLARWRDKSGLCRIERSPEWWGYRLHEHSGRRYRWISGWRGSSLVATAAWGIDPFESYPRATLAEFLFADDKAGRTVVTAAISAARTNGCAVLNTVATEPESARILRSCGFLILRPTPFMVRQLTPRTLKGNVHDPDAWRLLGADLDTL